MSDRTAEAIQAQLTEAKKKIKDLHVENKRLKEFEKGYANTLDDQDEEMEALNAEIERLKKAPTWLCHECTGQWAVSSRKEK